MTTRQRRLLLAGGIGLATVVAVLLGLQRWLLFPSRVATPTASAGEDIAGLQRIWLQVERGRVEAWFIPGDGVDAEKPGPLVVFAHGNGELIDQWPPVLAHYRQRGVSVLLAEYRGYGRSGGSPSEDAIVRDFVAFHDLVVARPEVDADRVVLHGRSLGGGVVGGLLKERGAAAVILQSTFTSVADLANEKWFVPRFIILDPFDTVAALEGFGGPTLIVHGRDDRLIPVEHANTLQQAASDSRLVLFDGGHNNTPPTWPELWTEVDAFLDEAGITTPQPG